MHVRSMDAAERLSRLEALLFSLKSVDSPNNTLDLGIWAATRDAELQPYTESLDACRALHSFLLPHIAACSLEWNAHRADCRLGNITEVARTPELAYCAAIIAALIAAEQKSD